MVVRLINVVELMFRYIFKSTIRQIRPNKAGLKCPSVHTYVRMYVRTFVRQQKVTSISMEFGMWIEVDE